MDDKKVVCVQFIDRFLPEIDGVVRVVENYANILSEDRPTYVVAPRYKGYSDEQRFEILRAKSFTSKSINVSIPIFNSNRKIRKYLKEKNVDIYHAHSPFIIGHLGLSLARKNNVPIVASFHSRYKDDFKQYVKLNFIVRFLMKYIVKFYDAVDVVWACSEKARDLLIEYGCNNEIRVMENGTDFTYPDNLDDLIDNARTEFKINKENKNLLYVGQIVWQKNLKLVLDTLELLVRKDPSYHLYIVGTGSMEKEIKKYSENLSLNDNVHFLGRISGRDTLKGVYAASDLFFFPSLYDTSGLVHREAAAMKVPSLLIEKSAVAEEVVDNVNGFLSINDSHTMSDKIIEIFANPELRREVGIKAEQTIPITWRKIVRKVDNEYQAILRNYKK